MAAASTMPVVIALLLGLAAASPAAAETIHVRAGGNLHEALNAARPGDEIVLQAGARFVGEFHLPSKPAGAVIVVRSSATLPDRRIVPGDAPLLPTLASGVNMPVLVCTAGCANWRFVGLNIEPTPTHASGEAIVIQDGVNITLDRILLVSKGDGIKRGIRGNGRQITVTRSHVAGIWRSGQDSQAFCAWDGAGPYTLTDNFFEAASENVMFGGANSASPANIPSDILVEGNHFSKPLAWKGQSRAVKNLFELKSAKRAVIRDNLFENNWTDAQSGAAILFTVRNDEGQSPWSVVEDVLFERNVVRNTEQGINVLGTDSYQPSGRTTRITIRHNLIQNSTGMSLLLGSEIGTMVVEHNTFVNGATPLYMYRGDVWPAAEGLGAPRAAKFAVERLTYRNNLAYHREYGVFGEGGAFGREILGQHAPEYVWGPNVFAGGTRPELYPAATLMPSENEHAAQFNADYSLTATSKYRKAGSDGQDLGVVWAGGAPGAAAIRPGPIAPSGLRIVVRDDQ